MDNSRTAWYNRFKFFFLNNRFVLFLLILLLIGLNIWVLTKISFVFTPLVVLVHTILLPLLLTGVAYYLLNPIVDYLERKGIKRGLAILALYLLLLAAIVLIILAVVPLIREQIEGLLNNFPAYSLQVEHQFRELIGSKFFNEVQQTLGVDTIDITTNVSKWATSILQNTLTRLGGILGAVTEIVLAVVTVPLVLFYLLKDGKKLTGFMLSFVPNALRAETGTIMKETNHQISSYIRGQIIVSFCIGTLLYIGYLIIGLDYSLILAITAACTSVVPYLGPAIAITPALIVASVTSPAMLLKMIAIWTIVQLIEGKFISPQIMGKTMRIHPVTIIFVILTAGKLFGILGIILAVPGYAVLKVIVSHIFEWFKIRSKLYEDRVS